jgi:dethiobiotin synthetase
VNGIFVVGTDTDIGKTVIACAFASALKKREIDVGVMKPFATSHKRYSSDFQSEDVSKLAAAAKVTDPEEVINPYFYSIATAPYLAAKMSGRAPPKLGFALEKLRQLSKKHEFMVVEGIGGIMVPLTRTETLLDFVKLAAIPVIIVASSKIGTINHTLLTFHACKERHVSVSAIIINNTPRKPSNVQHELRSLISTLTGIKKVIQVPKFRYHHNVAKVEKIIELDFLGF